MFNRGARFIKNKLDLKYLGQKIEAEKNPKFLGVTLDPGLNLGEHVNNLKDRPFLVFNKMKINSSVSVSSINLKKKSQRDHRPEDPCAHMGTKLLLLLKLILYLRGTK